MAQAPQTGGLLANKRDCVQQRNGADARIYMYVTRDTLVRPVVVCMYVQSTDAGARREPVISLTQD